MLPFKKNYYFYFKCMYYSSYYRVVASQKISYKKVFYEHAQKFAL